jgi:pentatricopeptide repeat protein
MSTRYYLPSTSLFPPKCMIYSSINVDSFQILQLFIYKTLTSSSKQKHLKVESEINKENQQHNPTTIKNSPTIISKNKQNKYKNNNKKEIEITTHNIDITPSIQPNLSSTLNHSTNHSFPSSPILHQSKLSSSSTSFQTQESPSFNKSHKSPTLQQQRQQIISTIQHLEKVITNFKFNTSPNCVTATKLILQCKQHNRIDLAFQVYQTLISHTKPDIYVFDSLMSACYSCGQSQRVLSLWNDMCHYSILPNKWCLGLLIRACAQFGDATTAKNIFNMIITGNIKFDLKVHKSFKHLDSNIIFKMH